MDEAGVYNNEEHREEQRERIEEVRADQDRIEHDRIEHERHEAGHQYDEEMNRHLAAADEVINAPKRSDKKDSDEMKQVKNSLRTVKRAMEEQIADNYEDFKKQVLDLSTEFGHLITACQNYLSRRKMARFRLFTRGRKRYKKVEALLAIVKQERVQLRDLDKNKELFELRAQGALVGNALINAVRDHAALDPNLVVGNEGWLVTGRLQTKSIDGMKYTMSRKSGEKPKSVIKSATAGRVLDYMGLDAYGNKPSLVLGRRNRSIYYGIKEKEQDAMRTMQQIEEEAGGTPSVTYEPSALRQLSNIKMLRVLLGMEQFDAKRDIAFSYEKKVVNGNDVYLVKSAKIHNFANAFSTRMTKKSLQNRAADTDFIVSYKEMIDFISDMDGDDVDYIAGDLLSSDQKKAFVSRLSFLKNWIEQQNSNQIEDEENRPRRFSAEDWNDAEKCERICKQIMNDKGSAFSVLFGENTHLSGKQGDMIWEAEEAERERARIAQEEEDRRKAQEEEDRRKAQEEEDRRRAQEEENRRRAQEEENRRRAQEEEDRRRAQEEEERTRKGFEEVRRQIEEMKRKEREEELRKQEEERRRREEEEENRLIEEELAEFERARQEKLRKRQEAEEKKNRITAMEIDDALQVVKTENEKLAKEAEDDFSEKILSTYSAEQIKAAVEAPNKEEQNEIEKTIRDASEKTRDVYGFGKKEYDPPYGERAEEEKAELVEEEAERYKDFCNRLVIPFYEANIELIKQYEIYLLKEGRTSRHYDNLLDKAKEFRNYVLVMSTIASADFKKIWGNKEFKKKTKHEQEKIDMLDEQRGELADYLTDLRHRFSDEASEQKNQTESFADARFAEAKDRTAADAEAAEKLIRDLIALRYSVRETDEDKENIDTEEKKLFDRCKTSGPSLDKLTKEEFENIRQVNELFAYKLYFDHVSLNRDELGKQSIPQNMTSNLYYDNVTVDVQSHREKEDGEAYIVTINRAGIHLNEKGKKDLTAIEKNGSFNCEVYPNPFSQQVTNKLRQGGETNYCSYHGTCGPASMAQIVNQIYGMNITNENMNVALLHKFKTFRTYYLPMRNESGKILLKDSPRPDWSRMGGTTIDDMSKLLDIFDIKHTKQSKTNPPADSKENRDEKTGLDKDILLFADTLKKGGTVQVAVCSDILQSKGEDPRKIPGFYDRKGNLKHRKRLEDGEGYTNHWINLTGACYAENKLIGFLYKDTGSGESGFVTAGLLDKAYRGVVEDDEVFSVMDSNFILVEKSGHFDAAEIKKRERQRAKEIVEENEMIEKLSVASGETVNALKDYYAFLEQWDKSITGPEYYRAEDIKKKKEYVTEYNKKKAAYDEIKKNQVVFGRVKYDGRYEKVETAITEWESRVTDIFKSIFDKYEAPVLNAIPDAEKKVKEEFKDMQDRLDATWIKDFFANWEKDLQSKDYSKEKHEEWNNRIKERKAPILEVRGRFRDLCKESSKVHHDIMFFFNAYKESDCQMPFTKLIGTINNKKKALSQKYKDIFEKYEPKKEKKEDKKEEEKA